MRCLLLNITFQAIALSAFPQLDSANKSFVYTILRREPGSDSIRYTDQIKAVTDFSFTENFKNSSIIGYDFSKKSKVNIKLSKKENAQLRKELRNFYGVRWRDSLFTNSRMIPADSMWSTISKGIRFAFAVNPNADYMSYSTVFQFSKPIFLRNRSIAIFYFLRLCSSQCGVEDFSVYKLDNGEYKRWLILSGRAF